MRASCGGLDWGYCVAVKEDRLIDHPRVTLAWIFAAHRRRQVRHIPSMMAALDARRRRTRRCWAIAARCVVGVVCHFGIWLVFRCDAPGSDARARRSAQVSGAPFRGRICGRRGRLRLWCARSISSIFRASGWSGPRTFQPPP